MILTCNVYCDTQSTSTLVMPFSPPPRPHNGKRKRVKSSIPSSEPPAKRERPFLSSQPQGTPNKGDNGQVSSNTEDVPQTIHPTIPTSISKLQLNQRPIIHDLTVISSSKINQKVTQILKLLYPESDNKNEGVKPDASAKTKEQSNGIIVRLSAKSNVASKAISVAEIVKREITSQRAKARDDPTMQQSVPQLFQYTQLHGVRLPPKQQQQQQGGKQSGKQGGKRSPLKAADGAKQPGEIAMDIKTAILEPPAKLEADQIPKSAVEPTDATPSEPTADTSAHRKPAKPLVVKSAKGKKTYIDADGYLVTREITSADEGYSDADEDMDAEALEKSTDEPTESNAGNEDEEEEDEEDTSLVTIPGAISTGQTDADAGAGHHTRYDSNAQEEHDEVPKAGAEPSDRDEDEDKDEEAAFTTLAPPAARAKDRERLALIESLSNSNAAKQKRKDERPTPVLTIYLTSRRFNGLAEELGEEVVK